MRISDWSSDVCSSELQFALGIKRRKVVEIEAVADYIVIVEIDGGELGQREIALAVLGPADLAFDGVAGTQAEFTNLIGRDVDVVGTSEIVRLGAAQETETVGQHLDRAEPHDLITEIGLFLEDAEKQILLAQRRGALEIGRAHV